MIERTVPVADEPKPKGSVAADSNTLSERVRSLRLPDNRRYDRRSRFPWLLGLLVLAGGGTFAGYKFLAQRAAADAPEKSPAADSAGAKPRLPGPSSSGSAPIAPTGDVALESKGYIVPAHQILVSPKVNGMIVELHLEEGRRVNKGDVLAVLETTEYDADHARAEALLGVAQQKLLELEHGNRPEEITAAKAELAEAQAQREQLHSAFKRNVTLKAGGNKVVTDTDYEASESQFKAMDRRVARLQANYRLMVEGARRERIDLARAEVKQAEADVAKTRWRLDNCTIRAPLSGTILKKNAEEGNIVNPIAFNGSFSVCEMADLSDLEVDLSIQERDIARVKVGQKCQVRSEAFSDRVYDGQVSRLMPIADRAKGAVTVRVKLRVPADEEGVYLKPEMSAIVSFLNDKSLADSK